MKTPDLIAKQVMEQASAPASKEQAQTGVQPHAQVAMQSGRIAQLHAYAAIANGNPVTQLQPAADNGLPPNLKSGVESLSGIAMDDVQVHYNSSKPATVQAHAYAQGTEIHIAPGQEQHLAHEAWHVVQQKQGRVKPTLQLKGVAINDDHFLETEADVMGEKAMRLPTAEQLRPNHEHHNAGNVTQHKAIQRSGNAVMQLRTNLAEQLEIREKLLDVRNWTTLAEVAALDDRISFQGAGAAPFLLLTANFNNYQATALQNINDYKNILKFANENQFTNYNDDGLDPVLVRIRAEHQEVKGVRDANTPAIVDAKKRAMVDAEVKPIMRDNAYGYNANAFRNAATFALSTAALTAWVNQFFGLDRSQIIHAAKTQADNNPGNATVWKGLSPQIDGKDTHLTIYNADIPVFADLLVTAATVRADSDAKADLVMADGALQTGIHFTAEYVAPPGLNPRLFGNPPDTKRHSAYALPGAITWNDFVAPMNTVMGVVRDDVWALVNQKKGFRP